MSHLSDVLSYLSDEINMQGICPISCVRINQSPQLCGGDSIHEISYHHAFHCLSLPDRPMSNTQT